MAGVGTFPEEQQKMKGLKRRVGAKRNLVDKLQNHEAHFDDDINVACKLFKTAVRAAVEVNEGIDSDRYKFTEAQFFEAMYKAQAIDPNLSKPNGLSRHQLFDFYSRIVERYEDSGRKINLGNERDMANFISRLPDTIRGSKKTYSRREVEMIISNVLAGTKSTDNLTDSNGIRTQIENYMKGRLIEAAKISPNIYDWTNNPYTGEKIKSWQERYLIADQVIRFSKLSPDVLKALAKGYDNMTFLEKDAFIKEFAKIHGGEASESRGDQQDHLYFRHPNLDLNMDAAATPLFPIFRKIEALSNKYKKAEAAGDMHESKGIQSEAILYMDANKQTLGNEYKVHLHAKPTLTPVVFDRLLLAFRTDPSLRDNIKLIKIDRVKSYEGEEVVPNIVIYPKRAASPAESLKITSRILISLQAHYSDLDIDSSNANEIPRYNDNLYGSNIIFIAQSGGNLKNDLRDMGILNRYFDPANNYSMMRP